VQPEILAYTLDSELSASMNPRPEITTGREQR
jgi:hypothetical protein